MKKSRALIALVLVFALMLSTGSVFVASTDLTGGYFGYKLNEGTATSVSDDGTLSVTQNADEVYNYPDTDANFFVNSGFEDSDKVVPNTTTGLKEVTSGWAAYKTQDILNLEMSSDAHSGSNALKMTILSANQSLMNYYSENAVYNDLVADQKYILSFWVKGDATPRIQYKDKDHTGATRTVVSGVNTNSWLLATQIVTADSDNEIKQLVINLSTTQPIEQSNVYIIVDDILFMKVSDAEAMVKQMITDLDVTSPTAARAIDDIEQWCEKLSLTDTDEYAAFESKKDAYSEYINSVYEVNYTNNIYLNSGFEASDAEATNWIIPTTKDTVSIVTDDTHSGKNALKYTATASTASESVVYNVTNNAQQVENDTYILSAWVKGNSPRFFYRPTVKESSYDSTTETVKVTLSGTTRYGNYDNSYSDWTLLTYSFSPVEVTVTTDDAGTELTTYWMVPAVTINPPDTEGAYTLIDDAALMKKSDAIANVEAMIANLDTKSQNAARAIDDIEQWVAVLGIENISNYDLFAMKKSGYVYYSGSNPLINASFEQSDSITAVSGTGFAKELTTGWTTAWGSDAAIYSITDDAHSGKNAISVEATAGTTTRLFNTNNIKYNLDDENYRNGIMEGLSANTEYIISYWVKGSGQTKAWGKTVDTNGYDVGYDYNSEYIVDPGDTWKLNTLKLTTNENGEFWFNIFTSNTGDSNITAIIDDVQVLTADEAIAHVDALIDTFAKLDSTDANYARANDDIKQWIDVLDDPDLTVKYDIALNQKYNIITPNDGYTHLAQGDYIASVSLKGDGIVNRVYGDNITNIESIATTLASDFVTYSNRVTVGAYGTHYMGVQLTDTTDVNTVEFKDFSLKRVGDVNESGEIEIRDMVRMVKGLNGTDNTVDSLVADYDNSDTFDKDDIAAVREKIMNTDKLAEVLRGKTVSVLGDSISTYKGYNKNNYTNTATINNRDYYHDNMKDNDGNSRNLTVDFTYWKQIIDITETRLLVNNAWAGASIRNQGGASRGVQLHDNYGYYEGETPDIILVHYGTNDYLSEYDIDQFATNYDEMVKAMQERYPDADIFLFTFPPYNVGEVDRLIEFNAKIREVAEKYGCPLVDLYNDSAFNLDTYTNLTFEGLHPNAEGMDAITDTIYNVFCEQYIK